MNLHDVAPSPPPRRLTDWWDQFIAAGSGARFRQSVEGNFVNYDSPEQRARQNFEDMQRQMRTLPRNRVELEAGRIVDLIFRFRAALEYAAVRTEVGQRAAFTVSREEYSALRQYVSPWTQDPLVTPIEYDRYDGTMRVHGVTVIPR